MVQEIKAYLTSDGFVFEEQENAIQHEKRLKFSKALDQHFIDNPYLTSSEAHAFIDYIEEQGERLYNLLKQRYGE